MATRIKFDSTFASTVLSCNSFTEAARALGFRGGTSQNISRIRAHCAELGLTPAYAKCYITWDRDALEKALEGASSWSYVLRALNLKVHGANLRTVKKWAEEWKLPVPTFTRELRSNSVRLDDLLKENTYYPSRKLKLRLIKAGYIKEECTLCGQGPLWNGLPLTLQLDHINGDTKDNRRDNLRILCPNCHTQTETYCGKKGKRRENIKTIRQKGFGSRAGANKVLHPTKEALQKLVWEMPTTRIAALLGVSDVAITKWCKGYKIDKPPRGYWRKLEVSRCCH